MAWGRCGGRSDLRRMGTLTRQLGVMLEGSERGPLCWLQSGWKHHLSDMGAWSTQILICILRLGIKNDRVSFWLCHLLEFMGLDFPISKVGGSIKWYLKTLVYTVLCLVFTWCSSLILWDQSCPPAQQRKLHCVWVSRKTKTLKAYILQWAQTGGRSLFTLWAQVEAVVLWGQDTRKEGSVSSLPEPWHPMTPSQNNPFSR